MQQSSMRTGARCAVAVTAALCVSVAFGPMAQAGGRSNLEAEFKAKSIALIPRFVGWPEASFPNPNSPFIIGILSSDEDFVRLVSNAVGGKSIGRHPVEVRHRPGPREIRRCHLLFVSEGAWSRKPLRGPLMRSIKNAPMLTIGEGESFVEAGGIARFKRDDNRLSLEFNEDAAKRSGLNISSKLLRLPFCTLVRDDN